MLRDFNPRAPRGARHAKRVAMAMQHLISIHAPREGRDRRDNNRHKDEQRFQSTRPARGATGNYRWKTKGEEKYFNPRAPRGARPCHWRDSLFFWGISIHAPREGRDHQSELQRREVRRHFNPRAPRGARPKVFSSRSSSLRISIHAPREGRDKVSSLRTKVTRLFQSTRPARGATAKVNKFLCTFLQKRQ